MTDVKPGDWVWIQQHSDVMVEGRTGTVTHETADLGLYMVRLDKPLDDGTDRVEVFDDEMVLLQSRNIVTIVTAADGACVAAVRNPDGRYIDITCSAHPGFSTVTYLPSLTEAERGHLDETVSRYANQHAETSHTTDALDRSRPS